MPIYHKDRTSRKTRKKKVKSSGKNAAAEQHSESGSATPKIIGQASNFHFQNEYQQTISTIPLEILDIILQKSYILTLLLARRVEPIRDLYYNYYHHNWHPSATGFRANNNRTKDKNIITKLASVDVCWFKRITRQRYKKTIWRHLAGLYRKLETGATIVRSNKRYLLEAIVPDRSFVRSLQSTNCISTTQMDLINRLLGYKDRNSTILRAICFRDDKVYLNFAKCLRSTNQHLVAGVIENGGVVAEVKVTSKKIMNRKMEERQLIRDLDYFRDKARSTEIGKFLNILKSWEMEILQAYQNKGVVFWFWCKTKEAVKKLQEMARGRNLIDTVRELFKYLSSNSEGRLLVPRNIRVDKGIFTKEVVTVIRQKSVVVNFCARLEGAESEFASGITKLGDEIYVLCRSYHSPESNSIRVFEDHTRFRLQRKIEIRKIKGPTDIGSNDAMEGCLYVADEQKECVWMIRAWINPTQVTKWLSDLGASFSLSVCNSSQLLIAKPRHPCMSSLEIYDPDAKLVRSIQLPMIERLRHAIETSTGNFIVVHEKRDATDKKWVPAVSEVSADGSMVLRQFIADDAKQDLTEPVYALLDADDQVFVADKDRSGKVVLFDSELRWNRVVCPRRDDSATSNRMIGPWRMFYDWKKQQLMVASVRNAKEGGVHVYIVQQK